MTQDEQTDPATATDPAYEPDPRRWRVLAVSLVVGFMSLLDVTIVNVAVPSIRSGLDTSAATIQWVVSGYALAFGMTLVAARDLSPLGIRVNTIAPGTINTPAYGKAADQLEQYWGPQVPFPKRMGRSTEYAQLAQSIIENDYLNGEIIRLDGALRFPPK
jgi:hypothetical protein